MKFLSAQQFKKIHQGFTLIELIVVIAILGILAVGLLFAINPIDKINSANDVSVISFLTQAGQANDTYAATHGNVFAAGTSVNTALSTLNTAGEVKFSSYTAPSATYDLHYAVATVGCPSAAVSCYAFWVTNLQALINKNGTPPASGPQYAWANGKGCYVAAGTAITATYTCP